MIRVLIADDDPLIREQVRLILSSTDDIDVVAEATTGTEAVAAVDRHLLDVVLMDIRMPGDGLDATQTIRRRHPLTEVVILTTFGEDEYVDRALQLGVSGFLLKASDPGELVGGIRAAAAGGACLSPRVAARLIRSVARRNTSARSGHDDLGRLTGRERQILVALAQGLSNAEIAAAQHLTEGTVKGYVSALFVRLGVRNRVEAAIVAHRGGLLADGDSHTL